MGYALLVMVLMVFCPSGLLGLADRLTRPAQPDARSAAETSVVAPDAAGRGRAMSTVLAVRDLKKSFGGIVAVDGVSFDVNGRRNSRHHRPERQRQVDACSTASSDSCGRARAMCISTAAR